LLSSLAKKAARNVLDSIHDGCYAKPLKKRFLITSPQLLEEVHLGVAVALEEGLIVPVIRDADSRTLAESARAGTLGVDEATGSAFTITNLGMYGIDFSTSIVNQPEVAISGASRIIEKLAVFDSEIAKRSMMVLHLTFDHRIVGGAAAAAFLRAVSELLEKLYLMFV
jgi:pyruvate dehydrogenase E2 component (dihydrolipoamide acetyltransferase)